jgi:hypothetical protein
MNPNKKARTQGEYNKDKNKESNEYVASLLTGMQERKKVLNGTENVSNEENNN